ncbi:GNAT family N-acetyltransferase [Bacillus sp. B1-b2]|uniref:GNAT family N-acetyltransferase n=1 Tax=Bacillus sp. B1-b2 TaxID=2653201 RepID=UPI00186A294E
MRETAVLLLLFSFYFREKQTDSFIGLVSIDSYHEGRYLEISYQLLPSWWGKGFCNRST